MKTFRYLFAVLAAGLLSACGGSDDDATPVLPGAAGGAGMPISQVAEMQGFTALLAAAEKAGLAPALADPNANVTVFAPTDAAFGALATGLGYADATALVEAFAPETLAAILSFHVLPERASAATLSASAQSTPATLYQFDGQPAPLAVDSTAGVTLTDAAGTTATVATADVTASNGVIHAIDKVLVPPGVLNIVQMAQLNPAFSSLVNAVVATGLDDDLGGSGPFTVFAPTDDAFAAAPAGLDNAQLTTVLTYHVLGTQVLAADIPFGAAIETLAGQSITINGGSVPTITDTTATSATIATTDIRASNGVIHVIDKVLIPSL